MAAHSGSLRSSIPLEEARKRFSIFDLLPAALAANRASREESTPIAHRSRRQTSRASTFNHLSTESAEGFSVVFVTSEAPRESSVMFATNVSDFLTNHAVGIVTRTISVAALPQAARRLTVYVFLLDTPASVDAFYRHVHCATVRTARAPWPTCQIVIICHADVLRTRPLQRTTSTLRRLQSAVSGSKRGVLSSEEPPTAVSNPLHTPISVGDDGDGRALPGVTIMRSAAPSSRSAASSVAVRARWRRAVKAALAGRQRPLSLFPIQTTPSAAAVLPTACDDGALSPHLRAVRGGEGWGGVRTRAEPCSCCSIHVALASSVAGPV